MKLLGSYFVWKDGIHAWYECILVDPMHPAIRKDYNYRRVLGIVA
jgi:large subunit ribosomal protein L15e